MKAVSLLRFLVTATVVVLAVLLGHALWKHYLYAPWTRDGRVRADVVRVAPDVSGLVDRMAVVDNQFVHKGDLLFVVDQARFRNAVAQAQANLAAAEAGARAAGANIAAAVASARARQEQYRMYAEQAQRRAPVDGYVTNLAVRVGDYAATGTPRLALIDAHSYYLYGYFEETKLPQLRVGDPVDVRLMAGGVHLTGTITGIAHGITDRDNPAGNDLLADVNPTFNWVRLAQRVPVRIAIDTSQLPPGAVLAAGMTATVEVHPRGVR